MFGGLPTDVVASHGSAWFCGFLAWLKGSWDLFCTHEGPLSADLIGGAPQHKRKRRRASWRHPCLLLSQECVRSGQVPFSCALKGDWVLEDALMHVIASLQPQSDRFSLGSRGCRERVSSPARKWDEASRSQQQRTARDETPCTLMNGDLREETKHADTSVSLFGGSPLDVAPNCFSASNFAN